jgi:hypothetical protein
MDLQTPPDKIAAARQRAALLIEAAGNRFQRADILRGNCPAQELVYGTGMDGRPCPRCDHDPADHGLPSAYNNRANPATLLQGEVQRQLLAFDGNSAAREEFHPAARTDITYGVMECIDRFGDLRVYITCSGNPTDAVKAAMLRLTALHEHLNWVRTIPNEHELQGYNRADGRPRTIKLTQVDNPPNVCAAAKLLQFAMSEHLAPVSLTEAYGRTGDLKPSCETCTQNIVQMMCGMPVARKIQFEGIRPNHDALIRTLEKKQELSDAVESWEGMIPIGDLKPRPDRHQFSNVYDYVARLCGPYAGTLANDGMVQLITSKEFLTTFQDNPDAREEQDPPAREMLEEDKPNLRERQILNKARAKALKGNRKAKTPAAAAAASPTDEEDEPKKNWKQLIRDKAAAEDETQ